MIVILLSYLNINTMLIETEVNQKILMIPKINDLNTHKSAEKYKKKSPSRIFMYTPSSIDSVAIMTSGAINGNEITNNPILLLHTIERTLNIILIAQYAHMYMQYNFICAINKSFATSYQSTDKTIDTANIIRE